MRVQHIEFLLFKEQVLCWSAGDISLAPSDNDQTANGYSIYSGIKVFGSVRFRVELLVPSNLELGPSSRTRLGARIELLETMNVYTCCTKGSHVFRL